MATGTVSAVVTVKDRDALDAAPCREGEREREGERKREIEIDRERAGEERVRERREGERDVEREREAPMCWVCAGSALVPLSLPLQETRRMAAESRHSVSDTSALRVFTRRQYVTQRMLRVKKMNHVACVECFNKAILSVQTL